MLALWIAHVLGTPGAVRPKLSEKTYSKAACMTLQLNEQQFTEWQRNTSTQSMPKIKMDKCRE
jgi:hypothetical protein